MFQLGVDFKGIMFFFWIEKDDVTKNFWATARQIGRLLGFRKPGRIIEKIVSGNPNARINPMEVTFSDGETKILYSFKDMLKICKYSELPEKVLDEIVDFLWSIAEEVPAMLESPEAKELTNEAEEPKEQKKPEEPKKEEVSDDEVIQTMKQVRHELSHLIYNIGELRKEIKKLLDEDKECCDFSCAGFALCPAAFLKTKEDKC